MKVIGIVGPYHSGKSFLANALLNASSGAVFVVGSTVDPMTEGIWTLNGSAALPDGTHVLVLDTEGFSSSNVSAEYDARVFAVTALMSSYLISNSIRVIDQVRGRPPASRTNMHSHKDTHARTPTQTDTRTHTRTHTRKQTHINLYLSLTQHTCAQRYTRSTLHMHVHMHRHRARWHSFIALHALPQGAVDHLELLAQRTRLFSAIAVDPAAVFTLPPLMWCVRVRVRVPGRSVGAPDMRGCASLGGPVRGACVSCRTVQDFVQEHIAGENATAWLQRLMRSRRADSEEHPGLGALFAEAQCHTLFLPATTPTALRNLNTCVYSPRRRAH